MMQSRNGIWSYRQLMFQNNAGGGTIDVRFSIPEGQYFLLKYVMVGKNNYAADRAVNIYKLDEDDKIRLALREISTVDNEFVSYPSDADLLPADIPFSGSDQLQIQAISLDQGETLLFAFEFELVEGTTLPSVDTSNSTGTLDVSSPTMNRVI